MCSSVIELVVGFSWCCGQSWPPAIVLATRRNVVKRGELGSLVLNGGNYGGEGCLWEEFGLRVSYSVLLGCG